MSCCRLRSQAFGGDSPPWMPTGRGSSRPGRAARQVDNLETARRVLELAQRTADEAIEAARGVADQTLGVARNETEAILAKARRQAEQITGDAAARARALERDAQERHRQAMGSLIQNREELERRVDDLRAFEREYRAKLQAWLEGQFRELLDRGYRPRGGSNDRRPAKACFGVAWPAHQRGAAPGGRDIRRCPVRDLPRRTGQPRDEPRIQEAHRQAPHPPEGNSQAPDEGGTR